MAAYNLLADEVKVFQGAEIPLYRRGVQVGGSGDVAVSPILEYRGGVVVFEIYRHSEGFAVKGIARHLIIEPSGDITNHNKTTPRGTLEVVIGRLLSPRQ